MALCEVDSIINLSLAFDNVLLLSCLSTYLSAYLTTCLTGYLPICVLDYLMCFLTKGQKINFQRTLIVCLALFDHCVRIGFFLGSFLSGKRRLL